MSSIRTDEFVVVVTAPIPALFDYLDDQVRLGAHMEKPSMMMLGGRMSYEFDAAQGRAVGAIIKMRGDFLGLHLFVEEMIVERTPPHRKMWKTIGEPRLLIMGGYKMGFELTPSGEAVRLRVFIEYETPKLWLARILSAPFASVYARWCVKRMAMDAQRYFLRNTSGPPGLPAAASRETR